VNTTPGGWVEGGDDGEAYDLDGRDAAGLQRRRGLGGLPVAGQQLGAAAIGMGGDPLEHVAEIGPGVEAVRFTRRHESSAPRQIRTRSPRRTSR
jgi:hypothetical protein